MHPVSGPGDSQPHNGAISRITWKVLNDPQSSHFYNCSFVLSGLSRLLGGCLCAGWGIRVLVGLLYARGAYMRWWGFRVLVGHPCAGGASMCWVGCLCLVIQ